MKKHGLQLPWSCDLAPALQPRVCVVGFGATSSPPDVPSALEVESDSKTMWRAAPSGACGLPSGACPIGSVSLLLLSSLLWSVTSSSPQTTCGMASEPASGLSIA
eukprot:CAMPEP_0171144386 /NCGR_PEP_ID=MMETSP0766_2-20121228/145839_1 /TAXON_ID=439317 /ORGANISM="Gambierdiscus australes, Strain CAWD 149" /LENGTH=104 /DNA_ID=CAMNT_0011608245 /DNA_START=262 /DNA_END=573 /DNA_ORIENTATION=-